MCGGGGYLEPGAPQMHVTDVLQSSVAGTYSYIPWLRGEANLPLYCRGQTQIYLSLYCKIHTGIEKNKLANNDHSCLSCNP